MKKLLFLCVLLLPVFASATTFTSCSGTGTRNWHTSTDWTPNGTPTFGDTITSIQSACVMQCEAGQSCNLGTSAAGAGSTDITIAAGGTLKVLAGATFTMRGGVAMKGALDIYGGTFLLDPAGAGDSRAYVIDTEGGGSPVVQICAESTCTTTTGTLGILNCAKGSSSTCTINHGAAFSGQIPGWTQVRGAVTNYGAAALPAINFNDGQTPTTVGFIAKGNSLFDNDGVVLMGWNSGTLADTFDGVSFTRCQDQSAGGNPFECLEVSNSTTTSGNRTFRVTASGYPSSHEYQLNMNVTGMTGGDSTHPGLIGYNVFMRFPGRTGNGLQNVLNVVDRINAPGTTSASALSASKTCADVFSDWVMLNHTSNQHHIVATNNTCGTTANTYTHMVFDGDGYRASDAGDDYQDGGVYTATNDLHINASGTLFTLNAASVETVTITHDTMFNDFGGSICELNCYAGGFLKQANSLFVLPSALQGTSLAGNDGIHSSSAYRSTFRQTATSSNTDWNFFWQMPGSGDPGAGAAKTSQIQVNLGATPSWVAVPTTASKTFTGTVTITGGVNVACTGCGTNAAAKDYIVDVTQSPNTYAIVQSVTNANAIVLTGAIPTYVGGDTVEVRPAYFSSGGTYGTDWGTHDQHINPFFQDSTRTVCSWWKIQAASTINCASQGGDYVATSGTSTTTINDTNVNFSTLGIVDNTDVVAVYSSDFNTFRGSAVVTSHTTTSISFSALTGTTSGDHFTFVTAPYNLGQSAIQLYGFDVSGNTVTPPAWVTSTIAKDIENYLLFGFAPTNPALFHAGGDSLTVGCCEVIPPNGGISVAN
jgi:hypothetical protein